MSNQIRSDRGFAATQRQLLVVTLAIFIATVASLPPTPVQAAPTAPDMLLTAAEIEALQQNRETESVRAAVAVLLDGSAPHKIRGANELLAAKENYSVTADGGGKNWEDRDFRVAEAMNKDARTLAMAYVVTGDRRYSDRAAQIIRRWALDPKTGMNPVVPQHKDRNGKLEQFAMLGTGITMPGMFYAADLLRGSPSWSAEDDQALRAWARAFATSLQPPQRLQPGWTNVRWFKILAVATAGVFADNAKLMNEAWAEYKAGIDQSIDEDGGMRWERKRLGEGALGYSFYSLGPMIQVAELAHRRGVDLYNYSAGGGRNLRLALNYHIQFAYDPGSFASPYAKDKRLWGEPGAIYSLAAHRFREQSYVDVAAHLQQQTGPGYFHAGMGLVQLTHPAQPQETTGPVTTQPPDQAQAEPATTDDTAQTRATPAMQPIKISFQPAGVPAPEGYMADMGAVFGDRGNGYHYGWHEDVSADARQRKTHSDPAYDTLIHSQRGGRNVPWAISVPKGTYTVYVVAGDAQWDDSVYRIAVNEQLVVDCVPNKKVRFCEGSVTVSTPEGWLTLQNAPESWNNKFALVHITPVQDAP